jgi:hypothetical protein
MDGEGNSRRSRGYGDATQQLGAHDPPLSFTAFVVAAVARAVASHPEVHAYLNDRTTR